MSESPSYLFRAMLHVPDMLRVPDLDLVPVIGRITVIPGLDGRDGVYIGCRGEFIPCSSDRLPSEKFRAELVIPIPAGDREPTRIPIAVHPEATPCGPLYRFRLANPPSGPIPAFRPIGDQPRDAFLALALAVGPGLNREENPDSPRESI